MAAMAKPAVILSPTPGIICSLVQRVKRPTIVRNADLGLAALLDPLLVAVVMRGAQALERTAPELVEVATVRLDVIADSRGYAAW